MLELTNLFLKIRAYKIQHSDDPIAHLLAQSEWSLSSREGPSGVARSRRIRGHAFTSEPDCEEVNKYPDR